MKFSHVVSLLTLAILSVSSAALAADPQYKKIKDITIGEAKNDLASRGIEMRL